MGSVSTKIRSGLLELSTDVGPLYASPSICERIYLLWTFRNFRRLPKQVLNQRQRQLVDKLCQASTLGQQKTAVRTRIIGVVENVHLVSDRKTQAAATAGKLVEIGAARAKHEMPRAVGSEGVSIPFGRQPQSRTAAFERRTRGGKAGARDASEQNVTWKMNRARVLLAWRGAGTRLSRNFAIATAIAAALLGTLLYFRNGWPTTPVVAPQVAAKAHTSAAAVPPTADSPAEHPTTSALPERLPKPSAARPVGQLQISAIPVRSATAVAGAIQSAAPTSTAPLAFSPGIPTESVAPIDSAKQPSSPAIASRQDQSTRGNAAIAREVETVSAKPLPPERVRIAAAPQSFSYPVAPNAALTGKVSLKLVIGTDGSVTDVTVLSGQGPLADAAVRAVRRWRYRPPVLNGHAAEAETTITFNFVGDDAVSMSFVQ